VICEKKGVVGRGVHGFVDSKTCIFFVSPGLCLRYFMMSMNRIGPFPGPYKLAVDSFCRSQDCRRVLAFTCTIGHLPLFLRDDQR
jgi:hypothetical protein